MEVSTLLIILEKAPSCTTGVMMDLDLLLAFIRCVKTLPCGPRHHKITTAPLYQVNALWLCSIIAMFFYFSATISLYPLQRTTSRQDIECPGDTIPYRCSVQSNSENVQLEWRVTLPDNASVIMRLFIDDSEVNDTIYLPWNVTATLTQYIVDEKVESEIVFTVLRNVSINGTRVECHSEALDSEVATINVNTSGLSLSHY